MKNIMMFLLSKRMMKEFKVISANIIFILFAELSIAPNEVARLKA